MEKIKLKPCPICGKQPRIIRDYGYEANGFGAWCTIKCGGLFKRHLKIEEGKASWERALYYASLRWNETVDLTNSYKAEIKTKSQKE
jgi:hypothetical protein